MPLRRTNQLISDILIIANDNGESFVPYDIYMLNAFPMFTNALEDVPGRYSQLQFIRSFKLTRDKIVDSILWSTHPSKQGTIEGRLIVAVQVVHVSVVVRYC